MMTSRIRNLAEHRREGGQALVETAIILPLLLVLLIGMVVFANAWRTSQTVTNVTREGARLAVLPGSTVSDVKARVRNRLQSSGLNPNSATITVEPDPLKGAPPGTKISVVTEYPVSLGIFDRVFTLLGGSVEETLTLSSTTNMRKE